MRKPSDRKPTIAITGANGFLGQELVRYFNAKGWRVIALVRRPGTPSGGLVEYRQYDITQPLSDDTLQAVDYVVHAAYIKLSRQQPDAVQLNIQGAERLLEAAAKQGVRRALFMSTMSAHDEATSAYGRQKLAIEQLFIDKGDVALRSGLILGHGGIVQDMAAFMKSKHVVPVIDGGKQPLQIIAVYDLVRAVETALLKNIGGVLTIASPQIYTYKDFYRSLAASLGVRVLFVPVPYYALLGAFNVAAFMRLPLNLGADNLRGLKQLRSADTLPDLKRLGLALDDLETALRKINGPVGRVSKK